MGRKVEPGRRPTSPAGHADRKHAEAGFTLIEIVCVVAILAIVAAILLPAFPRGTSRTRLEAFAIETAALLKADRNAAVRRRMPVATQIDALGRTIRSGATGRTVQLPSDVGFNATLAARCAQRPAGPTIRFFASGMSCGGVLALTRLGTGYEIRVNWLTGGVDVAALNRI
jgi:general secretion pathway protein H